jgi:hypothetical protein
VLVKPPVVVRIQAVDWEVVAEIDGSFGDAAAVAAKLRASGCAARRRRDEVLVNANADLREEKRELVADDDGLEIDRRW